MGFWCLGQRSDNLTAESVQGTALALEGVDNVHRGDGLPLGVLGVSHGITDNVLKENLQNTAGLLVDETGDSLDTATTSKTTDGRLRDTLDVITKNFPVALSASLSETLSSFAASSHVDLSCAETRMKRKFYPKNIYTRRAAARQNHGISTLIGRKYKAPTRVRASGLVETTAAQIADRLCHSDDLLLTLVF